MGRERAGDEDGGTPTPPAWPTHRPPLSQAASWRGVLRKKPPGPVLVSAHAVEREAALLRALAAAPTRGAARVLLPTVLASCDDASVLDTPFYVMHFVEGRVYVDPALPDVAPGERRAVYTSLATALAALHAVDAASVPPVARALGRSAAEYGARVVTTWDRQYRAQLPGHCSGGAAAAVLPEMAALSSFLLAAAPSLDDYADTTVVLHGDYRLDNVVFDGECVGQGCGSGGMFVDKKLCVSSMSSLP